MSVKDSLSLRPANAGDWPGIAALLIEHGLPIAGAREHLGTFLVAERDGTLVGCAGAEVYGDVALLRSVAVAPGQQRQGIGHALVAAMLREAQRRGIGSLHLLTVTAPEYFAQFGFKRGSLDKAPAVLHASAELQGACPACAAFMSLQLPAAARATGAATPAELPVAILGAGPVGLAAAAHLLERGIVPLILEARSSVGANLLDYGHVRLFSPWRYNVDRAVAAALRPTGWSAPPDDELPTAREVVERVLAPFAALPAVARALHLDTRVVAVSREGFDKVRTAGREKAPFVISAWYAGEPVEFRARAVIDATGTWATPNPLGANGLPARGEREHADSIFYGIPDVLGAHRARYAGRRTLVVGAGHSAANTLLALAELAREAPATQLAWAVRSPALARVFGGGEADALPARGRLGSALKALRDSGGLLFENGLRITAVRRERDGLAVQGVGPDGRPRVLRGFDQIVCATGQRPDLALATELRLKLDPWLESTEALGPLIDPNLHSCGTVRPHGHRELSHPEPGFYTLGVKSYGRAPTFLMATGFEQARSVAAAIAGDLQAADRVELDLPQTGVCSSDFAVTVDEAGGCCPASASQAAVTAQAVVEGPVQRRGAGGSAPARTTPRGRPVAVAVNSGCCG
jgi:N-acetylglutamate synthase-like GNAT family acetyltransferase